jgi:hypothetical protein
MEKAARDRPETTWWFLAAAILLCGLLMASLQTGKIALPFSGTIRRADHPVSFWLVCAAQLVLALSALAVHAAQFPTVCLG